VQCDKIGFTSMMISEHASQIWENIPNPELIMAAAALQTETIKFAPMAHILPHQHPAKLAMMVGWLSQILEGRYFMGIGAGAYPLASYIHGIKDAETTFLNEMVRESLFIMEKIWKREPFFHEGKFWSAGFPARGTGGHGRGRAAPAGQLCALWWRVPRICRDRLQRQFPLDEAGRRAQFQAGLDLLRLDALKRHWEIYPEANIKAGFTPNRQRHAVSQTVFCAETDAEAKRLVMEGPIGYCFNRYLIPIWRRFGMMDGFARDFGVDTLDVDLEFLTDNVFVVGSPDTIVDKLSHLSRRPAAGARCRSRRMITTTTRRLGSPCSSFFQRKLPRVSEFPVRS